ncbi:MAG TPA: chemotaxis response regulator protein-glutamate methylesterase [Aigarchaeota archaeon]|nr:chemotaxis response regulator protein-glutamate methylesterase [Aigarchaeota archaeon]HIQ30560.1 chemotaxis response regulator protein-glutamate methylesterase [Aquifex aeolicus]
MKKIRVLVVDDSAFMRKAIREILESDPTIEVVGTARNGKEAIDKVSELKPDVVTLDINMPVMDGKEALAVIMEKSPVPVVIVSSLTTEEATITMELLDMGAFDFVPKPSGTISLDIHKVATQIIEKVKEAYRSGRAVVSKRPASRTLKTSFRPTKRGLATYVVAIGISTGGPATLLDILQDCQVDEDTAYLVVQHMPPQFTPSLAKRLSEYTPIEFIHASHGQAVLGGYGYLAPGGWHMEITEEKKVRLFKDDNYIYYPSVDVLFESVAKVFCPHAIGVILTGIGRDGAQGLLKMKDRGCVTIAESQETAVVYGMPAAAKEIGAALEILPSYRIASAIMKYLRRLKNSGRESL